MESTRELWISRLLQLFSHQGDPLYAGKNTLCLSAPMLSYISSKIQLLPKDGAQVPVLDVARCLEKVVALKVVEDNAIGLTTPLNLSHFGALSTLELKRLPLQYVKGLQHLQKQLKVLIVQRCLNDMEHLLVSCGGDDSSSQPWPVLAQLNLSRNSISSAGTALQLLPALKILDLSRNCLCGDIDGLKHLSAVEQLHLGYNRLMAVPPLSGRLSRTLTTLNLRGNSLDDLDGVQSLVSLRSLQVQENCLSRSQSIQPLLSLHSITELGLEGNPLAFHPQYRLIVVHNLSTLLAPLQFALDGRPLSVSERKVLSKRARLLTTVPRPPPVVVTEYCSEEEFGTSELDVKRAAMSESSAPRRIQHRVRKARAISIGDDSDAEVDGPSKSFEDSLLRDRPEVRKFQKLRKTLDKNWLKGAPEERVHRQVITVTKVQNSGEPQAPPILQSPVTDSLQTDIEIRDEEFVTSSPLDNTQNTSSEDEGEGFIPGETFLVEMYESDFDDDANDVVQATDRKLLIGVTERFFEERDVSTAEVVDRLDLQCLIGVKTDTLYVKLLFDHARRDRRQREYTMQNSSDIGKLKDLLDAIVTENQKNMVVSTKLECLRCHATFLKSEALELESISTFVSYENSKTYACPFCKSQYHFEQEPVINDAVEPPSLPHSSSPASKSVLVVPASKQQGSEPSEEPESTEISDAAEAVLTLEQSPPMTEEDATPTRSNSKPVAKVEPRRKVDDLRFMHSNLKLYFECDVFKEEGECLKEALVVSVMDRSANTPETRQVVVFSNQKVYFYSISSGDAGIRDLSPSKLSEKIVLPLNMLTFIEIGPHYQFVLLEFKQSSQLLLFRDKERCKRVTNILPVIVADTLNSSLQGVAISETTRLCLLHEVILADPLPVEYYIAHHCHQAMKATSTKLKDAFGEAELSQWIRDNSDFEDEEKLEELLQKFVHLHILDAVPGNASLDDLQAEQMYKWNFSRFTTAPVANCTVFMCDYDLDSPQAAVLCRDKLYLVKDNYRHWPLSKFTTMHLQGVAHPQYELIEQALITDVHKLNFSGRTVYANFFQEDTRQDKARHSWTVTFETEEATALFLSLVRQRWKDAFHVDLELNSSDIP